MQEESMSELPDTTEQNPLEHVQPQVELPVAMRSVGPVVGMSCESVYKLIGEDCVITNIGFE